MTVKLSGFKALDRELAKLASVATRKASARRALKKAAQPLADLAESLAPRKSGDLAISVGVGTKLTKRQAGLHRKMFASDKAAVEMFVGAGGLAQATQQEFGNFRHAPKPFMRPAWDQDKMQMLGRLKVELWADIEKAVARAEARAARG
jgi:HK97 gp10 family phage protein